MITVAFRLMLDRWRQLLAVAGIMLALCLVAALPMIAVGGSYVVDALRSEATASQSGTSAQTAGVITSDGPTMIQPGATYDSTASSAGPEGWATGRMAGFVVAALVFALAALAIASASYVAGVAVALGSDVRPALRLGLHTLLVAGSQLTFVYLWPLAALLAGCVLGALVAMPLGIAVLVAAYIWMLAVTGRAFAVLGAVATGDRAWRPRRALDLLDGSLGVTGVLGVVVVCLVGGALALIPVLGILVNVFNVVFAYAGIAAFHVVIGGDTLQPDGTTPAARRPRTNTDDEPGTPGSSSLRNVSNGAQAPPAATAAHAAPPGSTPATAQLVASRTFEGEIAHAQSWGDWIQLAIPTKISVQVGWSGGPNAPLVYLLDEAGQPRCAPVAPTMSGSSSWLDAPAGTSYVAVQVQSPGAQRLAVTIWLPSTVAGQTRAA